MGDGRPARWRQLNTVRSEPARLVISRGRGNGEEGFLPERELLGNDKDRRRH